MSYYFSAPLMLCLTLLLATSCKKDPDPTPTVDVQLISNIAADPDTPRTERFTLYSIANQTIVPNTDSASNAWDIGFRGTTIIVNGGNIRTGAGGAYIYEGIYDEFLEVPADANFRQDNSESDLAIPTGSGNGWYNYNPIANVISPLAGKVLVIRTADGKFAKIEIVSYYENAPANPSAADRSRFYSFRLAYQPDGSRKF